MTRTASTRSRGRCSDKDRRHKAIARSIVDWAAMVALDKSIDDGCQARSAPRRRVGYRADADTPISTGTNPRRTRLPALRRTARTTSSSVTRPMPTLTSATWTASIRMVRADSRSCLEVDVVLLAAVRKYRCARARGNARRCLRRGRCRTARGCQAAAGRCRAR